MKYSPYESVETFEKIVAEYYAHKPKPGDLK